MIPESKDSKAILFKPKSPLLIILSLCGVLSSIDLNYELFLVAIEVNNVRADWLLSSKATTTELSSSDVVPKDQFSFRCILPEGPCSLSGLLIARHHRAPWPGDLTALFFSHQPPLLVSPPEGERKIPITPMRPRPSCGACYRLDRGGGLSTAPLRWCRSS